jgi:hypothetical protein
MILFSLLQSSAIFEKYNEENGEEKIKLLAPLGLRYFSPKEIANILCFPKHFGKNNSFEK